MTTGDLTLTEGPANIITTPYTWQISDISQSCDEFCQSLSGTCNTDAVRLEPSNFASVAEDFVCKLPLLSGCGDEAGTYDPSTQFCYFADPTCVAQNRTMASMECSTKISGSSRFCPCELPVEATTGGSDSTTGAYQDTMSSGEKIRGFSLFSVLLVIPLFVALNEKMAITMVLLLCLNLASAHNWINSPSRSHGASAVQPCKGSTSEYPHAQVGPGQAFQVEWMQGHGGFAYFAIQRTDIENNLGLNSYAILDEYIADAPKDRFVTMNTHI
jgi:hypothetical protein